MRRGGRPDLCGLWDAAAAPGPRGPQSPPARCPSPSSEAPCDWQPGPGRAWLRMGACLGGQNSAPCVKLSPLFKKKNNRKCEASEKNETSQNATCASRPAARPQRHGGLTQSETELAVPTGWPLPPPALSHSHWWPLVPTEAGGGSGFVGPALPAGQLFTAIIPSPQGPEGHCSPSQGLGLRLTCWTFPACIRLWPRARGAARAQERV